MLVGIDDILNKARQSGYAVGAFNTNNVETALGILEAAVEKKSPVILAFGEGASGPVPLELLIGAVRLAAQPLPVPVALILDHGRSIEAVVRAIRGGATSVMFDGSLLALADNVERTREVVRVARAVGVAVEAEIGHVGQGSAYATTGDERERWFTKPEEAAEFVELTAVDALAVAVGTAHGVYVGKGAELDYDRLCLIREAVPVPLVLHGGSGTGEAKLAKAVSCGIAKVNIYTDMALEARRRVKAATCRTEDNPDFVGLLLKAKAAFKDTSARYMDVFGSSGRA